MLMSYVCVSRDHPKVGVFVLLVISNARALCCTPSERHVYASSYDVEHSARAPVCRSVVTVATQRGLAHNALIVLNP